MSDVGRARESVQQLRRDLIELVKVELEQQRFINASRGTSHLQAIDEVAQWVLGLESKFPHNEDRGHYDALAAGAGAGGGEEVD